MLKRLPDTNRRVDADIPSAPASCCPPSVELPDGFTLETDFPIDRPVTDAELEAIVRLLGEDLARLLVQSSSH